MCYDRSSAMRVKQCCYVFGAKDSSGLWHLLLAGVLSLHRSWITDLKGITEEMPEAGRNSVSAASKEV